MIRRLAIFNPAAGLGPSNHRLLARLSRLGLLPELASTSAPGDAMRIARLSEGYDELLVIGGDGTIAEVINGMDRTRQQLALLPAGHGNCLARDLGVGRLSDALAALDARRSVTIDLMRVRTQPREGAAGTRLAASTLALGYVADVVRAGRSHLAWLGRHAYTAAAVSTRPRALPLRLDRGESRYVTTLVVNNTAHLANFRTFHGARLDDGALDVLESDYGWWRQMLHNGAILAGSTRWGPARRWQVVELSLRLPRPAPLMIDGELLEAITAVDIACEPAAVRCLRAP